MENFVVSARKYRPQRFDEVVGQQHVTTTLKNAIKSNKLAHSFLFCGPRGIGKTTCARILAKTINCENITADVEACNTCESCKSFNANSSFNIFEIDAASNSHVEDIRNLIEQVRYAPQSGKYKIYIIDEVHMLSQSAFNAFLKTLEEPPPYVKFILATTEKHKIIPTILSRCQIFDFRRISIGDMVKHLQGICEKEGIEAEPDALHVIAMKADGALRDALSMFDRLAGYGDGRITYATVIEALNILDYDYYFRITDNMLAEDLAGNMLLLDEIYMKGFEGDNLLSGLSEHFRNLMVCKDIETLKLLPVSKGLKEKYLQQAYLASTGFLLNALNICNQAEQGYRNSNNKRLHVELAMMKLTYLNRVVRILDGETLDVQGKKKALAKPDDEPAPVVKPKASQSSEKQVSGTSAKNANDKAIEKPTKPPVKIDGEDELTGGVSLSDIDALLREDNQPARNYQESQKNETVADDEVAETGEDVAPVDEKRLLEAWYAYAEQKKDRKALYAMFHKYTPVVEGTRVIIRLNNRVDMELMQNEKVGLLEFLKAQPGLRKVDFEIQKIEPADMDEKNQPLSEKDKYLAMCKKQPLLETLRKEFDLDLDY